MTVCHFFHLYFLSFFAYISNIQYVSLVSTYPIICILLYSNITSFYIIFILRFQLIRLYSRSFFIHFIHFFLIHHYSVTNLRKSLINNLYNILSRPIVGTLQWAVSSGAIICFRWRAHSWCAATSPSYMTWISASSAIKR